MIFTDLSFPALGSYRKAFSGTVNPLIITGPDNGDLPASGSAKETAREDFVEIIFSKGDVLEVLRMTGPGPDYATLASLAQKAYSKIP